MSHSYLFRDDYSEGAHPRILEAFLRTNTQQEAAYGSDRFSQEAEGLINKVINNPKANVHFVTTGTQANLICLSSILKPYESIIAVDTGHPNVHEAGAIEATGHKINVVPGVEGRLTPKAIREVVDAHADEHMVKPRAVYISQATELGTIYNKHQLQELSRSANKRVFIFILMVQGLAALLCLKTQISIYLQLLIYVTCFILEALKMVPYLEKQL